MDKNKISTWLRNEVVKYECSFYPGKNVELFGKIAYVKGTIGYDIDQLFKKIVDYCIETNLLNDVGTPIINARNKGALQVFIYNLSKK